MTEKQNAWREANYVKAICKELREPVDFAGTDPLQIKAADLIETLYLAALPQITATSLHPRGWEPFDFKANVDLSEAAKSVASLYAMASVHSSPHPRGEEIAKIIGGDIFGSPDSSVGPATVSARQNALTKADAILALFAAPPPAGADAVREALEKQLTHYDKTIAEAESDYALSDTGRQRVIECCLYAKGAIKKFATTLLPAPQPQEKPTGDQP